MAKKEAPAIKMGCDPEFFLLKDDKLVPSCDLIGGEKGSGIEIFPKYRGYKWLEDNVAVEINTPAFEDSNALLLMGKAIVHGLNNKGLKALLVPEAKFSAASLVHPKAKIFGCDPDFCAYDNLGREPRKVDATEFGNQRFAGGHIHLSYPNPHNVPAFAVAMIFDIMVGLPVVHYDRQAGRRKAYGAAGLYRAKKYDDGASGIEYRTPSNFWLRWLLQSTDAVKNSAPSLSGNFYSLAALFDNVSSIGRSIAERPVELGEFFNKVPFQDIRNAINKEDADAALRLWNVIYDAVMTTNCGLYVNSFKPYNPKYNLKSPSLIPVIDFLTEEEPE